MTCADFCSFQISRYPVLPPVQASKDEEEKEREEDGGSGDEMVGGGGEEMGVVSSASPAEAVIDNSTSPST